MQLILSLAKIYYTCNCTYFAAEYISNIFSLEENTLGGKLLLDKYHQVIKLRSMSDFQGKIDFKVLQSCLEQLKASIKRLSLEGPILYSSTTTF